MENKYNKYMIFSVLSLLIITASLVLINFNYGFSQDPDSYSVVSHARQLPEIGYIRSRTWGFPLYELIIYPLIAYLGITAGKAYSFVFCLANVYIFYKICLMETNENLGLSFFASLGFAVLPVSITSGNVILETSQGMFFALYSLLFFFRFLKDKQKKEVYISFILAGLATATRPDYIIFSACLGIVVIIKKELSYSHLIKLILLYIFFSVTPYFLVYGNLYTSLSVVIQDSIIRKIIRAILGVAALFGLPAIFIIICGLGLYHKNITAKLNSLQADPFSILFTSAVVLYAIRYLLLPDELEYIYIIVPLVMILLLKMISRPSFFIVLAIALILPNFIQVSIFVRDPSTYNNKFSLGISPGALFQERSMRLLNEYKVNELPALEKQVAAEYGKTIYSADPSEIPGALVIIPEENLRYYRKDRVGGVFNRVFDSQTVIVYDLPNNYGWRVFMAYQKWRKITIQDFIRVTKIPGS
jgi:hypothetical protein